MKKAITALMLVCFVTTGCTGTFSLTKKVYNWHRSQSDKWADEFGFLVCALLPIYGLSTFADAIVFNSIEFWTGNNPILSKGETNTKFVKTKDGEATVSFNADAQKMNIDSKSAPSISLQKIDNMVYTKDKQGNILYVTAMNPKGEFLVYNKNLELVKSYSPQEIALLKEKYNR